jgi:hypothetical protein
MAMSEQESADLAKRRGAAAAKISDPEKRQKFIEAQGKYEEEKDSSPLKKVTSIITPTKLDTEASAVEASGGTKGLESYKKGTAYVPKTGKAILHEGEAVIPAEKNNAMGLAESALAHGEQKEPPKPKKRIKSIHTRKAKSGGYIHEHHHTRPDHHPVEEHVSADKEAMLAHMAEQAPNMGEPEGDEQAAAPSGGAPSPTMA